MKYLSTSKKVSVIRSTSDGHRRERGELTTPSGMTENQLCNSRAEENFLALAQIGRRILRGGDDFIQNIETNLLGQANCCQ